MAFTYRFKRFNVESTIDFDGYEAAFGKAFGDVLSGAAYPLDIVGEGQTKTRAQILAQGFADLGLNADGQIGYLAANEAHLSAAPEPPPELVPGQPYP